MLFRRLVFFAATVLVKLMKCLDTQRLKPGGKGFCTVYDEGKCDNGGIW